MSTKGPPPGGPFRVEIAIARVRPGFDDLPLPTYETAGAAGMDLRAAVEVLILPAGGRALCPTGIAVAIPDGFEGSVRPRSGLALRHGIGLVNGPGTVDSDYRGEIQVLLVNHGAASYTVRRGERIAQLVVSPVARVAWAPVASLPGSGRGGGGFGSTG